eukprot:s347_g6.t1
MFRQLLIRDGLGWQLVSWPLPPTRLLLFSPSFAVLSGTALPHGLPTGIQKEFPLSVKDQQETEAWQLLSHQRLEEELQVEVDGYVSFSVDRPRGQAPLVLRELPETVGSKVWRGAWLLWKSLEVYGLHGASNILELGSGCGLVGLLLAADRGLRVTLSETRSAYAGAAVTFENLRQNVETNRWSIRQSSGGEVEVLELDWTQGLDKKHDFDLVIGSDILYEPHLFEDLLDVLQAAADRAILVQNLARKGTEYFLQLCEQRCVAVRAVDVSHLDEEMWLQDAKDGVYQCWFLDFSAAVEGC